MICLWALWWLNMDAERSSPTGATVSCHEPVTAVNVASDPTLHTCSCCGTPYSRNEWDALALIGVQVIEADAFGPAEAAELRNCACGSTLAVEVAA